MSYNNYLLMKLVKDINKINQIKKVSDKEAEEAIKKLLSLDWGRSRKRGFTRDPQKSCESFQRVF